MFTDLYRDHPAFCSLGVDDDLSCSYEPVLAFAERLEALWLYSSYMRGASYSKLSSVEKKDLKNESISLLESVYGGLISQLPPDNDKTRCFFGDLFLESKLLLMSDLQALSFYDSSSSVSRSRCFHSEQHDVSVAKLFDQGYSFASFSPDLVDNLLSILAPEIKKLKSKEIQGLSKRGDLSTSSGDLVAQATQLLDSASNSAGFNEIMSYYLGFEAGVTGLAVEIGSSSSVWAHSCYEGLNPSTIYMHRDESIAHPKLFLYLTEIDRSNGAFSIVENSDDLHGAPSCLQSLVGRIIARVGRNEQHQTYGYWRHVYHHAFGCQDFRRQFMRLPSEMRYCSHYGWDVNPQSNLHSELLKSERFLEGGPGSCILFDGYRVTHKALVRSNCNHISIQAIFGPKSKPSFAQKVVNKSRGLLRRSRVMMNDIN